MAHGVGYNLNRAETAELVQELQNLNSHLTSLLEKLHRLQTAGTLETLLELGEVIQAAKDSLTPGTVSNLVTQVVHTLSLLDGIQSLGGYELIVGTFQALEEAIRENKEQPPRSFWSLLQVLRKDSQVKQSLGVLVSFLQKLSNHLALFR